MIRTLGSIVSSQSVQLYISNLERRSPRPNRVSAARHAIFFSVLKMDADGDENCSLIQGHTANKNPQLDDDNLDLPDCSAKKCKVYKRRWYILFVFTLTSIVSNFMWNTWGPIQRPCRVVFGWQTWTVLLLSSFGAICPILGFIPSTWPMDTKGITSLVLLHFYYLSWPHSLP